jgi:hypothetical protein
MSRDWTRRQVLAQAGAAAAGAAGLGIAGCSSAVSPAGGAGSHAARAAGGLQHFVSRPDLTPPEVTLTRPGLSPGSRYTFLNAPWSGPGHGGSVIRDSRGDLIWLGANTPAHHRMDFTTQAYQGRAVLTWWEGEVTPGGWGLGAGVIADSSYRTIHTIHAARGLMADLHELFLTPEGTALITAYRHRTADLSSVGGPARGVVISGVAQEIDVATGRLLLEWDSLDHVPLTESYQEFSGGTTANPYNYFHINSIAVAPDGDLLISGRNTWAVYKVARRSGRIAWRLGGRKSDFRLGPGVRFYWQHDARPHGPAMLTLFDNGAAPARERRSRALSIHLDTRAMRATLAQAFTHPGRVLLANAMGSMQLLPGGRVFVGWGTEPYFSEFGPGGTLLLDGKITTGDPSYRAFSHQWAGRPAELPAAAARPAAAGGARVYASWNGATEVASWSVLAGPAASALAVAGSARRAGFETEVQVPGAGPWFAVEPRDASGRVLARSAPARLVSG